MELSLEMSVRGEAAEPAHIRAVARAAERVGFARLGYTDHPAPSAKWLRSGGHPTYDPFAALAHLAALTDRIGLMTYLAVLPYRNPFVLAKSVATVDRLSGGRLTLVAGTGYLRSEFAALGQDFAARNERFDEAVEVLRRVFVDDDLRLPGSDFEAHGVVCDPPPVQLPHPPIWVGGSSAAARERVARYGAGWAPLMPSPEFAKVVKSAPISSVAELADAVADLHRRVAAAGRDPASIEVQVQVPAFRLLADSEDRLLTHLGELADAGVTGIVAPAPDGSAAEVAEAVEALGSAVLPHI